MSVSIRDGGLADLDEVMTTMVEAFPPAFGEAWTRPQCRGMIGIPGIRVLLAREGDEPVGFAMIRTVVDEAELLLLAVRPAARRGGIGRALLGKAVLAARAQGAERMHLEMREGNPALALYAAEGFREMGRRPGYYRGDDGRSYDALTLSRPISLV